MNKKDKLSIEFSSFATKKMGINSNKLDSFLNHQITNFTPHIIEERPLNIASMDVFSRLMMDRIIFLGVPIYDDVANIVIAQLLFLESVDPKRDIQMYINCPGGNLYSGLGLYDTMQYLSNEITTICVGMAASLGAVLLAAGAKGKRTALKHSRIMLHQPSGSIGGQASDILITANEIKKIKSELYQIITHHTGQPLDKINQDCERDFWMNSQEALDYGIVDEVLTNKSKK